MAAEGDPVAETSSLSPKQKMMKVQEECKMLEKVLQAFRVQVLIWIGNSSSNPEQA
jgi:CO dehydrogenase/acetyl-CoA synthase delta subunit